MLSAFVLFFFRAVRDVGGGVWWRRGSGRCRNCGMNFDSIPSQRSVDLCSLAANLICCVNGDCSDVGLLYCFVCNMFSCTRNSNKTLL